MATIYGTVKQHQGWKDVSSQLGCGSTFKIFLPAILSDGKGKRIPLRQPHLAAGSETILLVEDDLYVQMVARAAFEASGYRFWEAADGLEALTIWKANAPQID